MTDLFTAQLGSYGFTPQEITQLIKLSNLKVLPAKSTLIHQNSAASEFYFLIDGFCHSCYLTEQGKQFSKEFYWKGDWVVGFEELLDQTPSPYTLETITPTRLIALPITLLNQWRKDANLLYIKLLETQLVYKERKERFMLLYSPQSRYEIFCQHYPDLHSQLSDYQVAAYLGITHISLSRIKNRIKKLT
ncbi:Crp/Fnr family transcriptional regulator [Aliivibrio sp. S3MY1]|uniref:Crp/Fnr family transcriptional regulator n=1 Tax=unclassified Aliivibrio TaxID=2645654 RepID=UPI002378D3C4|nr:MULTISPECIES: Crp/Fnr family transcriptional regulator [unclassified Aliivibrio]MDD9196366.1 Crp/Fnr family transcriptional regulator [Aliivibrio sp. S3MY1]MDD9199670.1 Crp/Fnr family transcriptional regulator [Aliivibrio sp. S2MY1]